MIYTRFGSEVEIINGNMETGEVDIKFKDTGKILKTYIYELRADNGIKEIEDEIKNDITGKKIKELIKALGDYGIYDAENDYISEENVELLLKAIREQIKEKK